MKKIFIFILFIISIANIQSLQLSPMAKAVKIEFPKQYEIIKGRAIDDQGKAAVQQINEECRSLYNIMIMLEEDTYNYQLLVFAEGIIYFSRGDSLKNNSELFIHWTETWDTEYFMRLDLYWNIIEKTMSEG